MYLDELEMQYSLRCSQWNKQRHASESCSVIKSKAAMPYGLNKTDSAVNRINGLRDCSGSPHIYRSVGNGPRQAESLHSPPSTLHSLLVR